MAADDVGCEAFLLELLAKVCAGFGAYRFRFGIANQRMGVFAISSFRLINVMLVALCFWNAALTHSHGNNGVTALFKECPADVNVLAWKSLMDEENIHAFVMR